MELDQISAFPPKKKFGCVEKSNPKRTTKLGKYIGYLTWGSRACKCKGAERLGTVTPSPKLPMSFFVS